MASRAIYGKPGGGKSYLATQWIVDDIISSDRPVITNLNLNLEAWNPYLEKMGHSPINVYERFRILDFDQVKEFWRFRSVDDSCVHRSLTPDEIKAGVRPDESHFSKGGVLYVLDELHRHLNSRQWQQTGPVVLDYISMHRHFGDDVIWMSQDVPNVDKQWRSVTQDYTLVRNYGKESWRGIRKGDGLEARTFLDYDPTGEKAVAQEVKTWKIDPEGIGSLYKTSAVGGDADKGKKAKGIHIGWLWAAIGFVAFLAILAGWYGPRYFTKKMSANRADFKTPYMEQLNRSRPAGGAPLDTPAIGDKATDDTATHILGVPLQNWTAAEFLDAGKGEKGFPGDTKIYPNGGNNAVIVTGKNLENVVAVSEMVRSWDSSSRLVTIHAVVGRLSRGRGLRLGLYDLFYNSARGSRTKGLTDLMEAAVYDFATGIVTFGSTVAARHALEAVTEFEASDYRFEVVSKPSITVVAGTPGTFTTGREIPIPVTTRDVTGSQTSVQYKRAEFKFEVLPTFLSDSVCRLKVKQENADVIGSAEVGGDAVPTLSQQTMETTIDLQGGQIGYLGGMIVRSEQTDDRGLPLLRKIPLVNLVTGSQKKGGEESELILLVSVVLHGQGESAVPVRRAQPVDKRKRWFNDTILPVKNPAKPGESTPVKPKKK